MNVQIYTDGQPMRGYHKSIAAATGFADREMLDEIEDVMRNDIFRSTLDWQDRHTFDRGAREAVGLIAAMRQFEREFFAANPGATKTDMLSAACAA